MRRRNTIDSSFNEINSMNMQQDDDLRSNKSRKSRKSNKKKMNHKPSKSEIPTQMNFLGSPPITEE